MALFAFLVLAAASPAAAAPVFAPYLDATLNEPPALVSAQRSTGAKVLNLGFVVGRGGRCAAAWGGAIPVGGRPWASQVARVRAAGADVQVSFGGQAGKNLSSVCRTDTSLAAAYLAAIDAYRATRIDLDIEGPALADRTGALRMVRALARVEARRPRLHVVLTVPVDPRGIGPVSLAIVRAARQSHTRLDVVNIMTMDYGPAEAARHSMYVNARLAATSTVAQLNRASPRRGGWWPALGITPMIGVNDEASEIFGLSDARSLVAFARARHVAQVSFWSVDRDRACSVPAPTARNDCSGVAQSPFQFSAIFRG